MAGLGTTASSTEEYPQDIIEITYPTYTFSNPDQYKDDRMILIEIRDLLKKMSNQLDIISRRQLR